MTTDELIAYYQALLIVQYALQPNALATVAAYVSQIVADQIIAQTRDAFNFTTVPGGLSDSAQGAQLDTIAAYRGVSRNVFGSDVTRSYTLMPTYGDSHADTDPGFALYGTPPTWYFKRYADDNLPIYTMNDAELTRVTQVRAQSQSNLLSVAEVDNILFPFFGENAAVFESANMEITYLFLSSDPDSLSFLLYDTKSLPRPAGVALNIIHNSSISGIFGFQFYSKAINGTFVGYGLYGTPLPASYLRYS